MKPIYHIRLNNGDEIFGSIEELSDRIIVEQPLCATEIGDQEGNVCIGLIGYLPYSQLSKCSIDKNHIITFSKVNSVTKKFYQLSKYFTNQHDQLMMEKLNSTSDYMQKLIENDNLTDGLAGRWIHETNTEYIN